MATIYKGQTALKIEINTFVDISEATSLKIAYVKPSGVKGAFTASKSNNSTSIFYDIQNETDLDEAGIWKFYADVVFKDGRKALGAVSKVKILEKP